MAQLYARNVPGSADLRTGAGGLGAAPALAGARQRPADRVHFLGQRGQTPGRRRPSVVRWVEPFRTPPRPMVARTHDSTQLPTT